MADHSTLAVHLLRLHETKLKHQVIILMERPWKLFRCLKVEDGLIDQSEDIIVHEELLNEGSFVMWFQPRAHIGGHYFRGDGYLINRLCWDLFCRLKSGVEHVLVVTGLFEEATGVLVPDRVWHQ